VVTHPSAGRRWNLVVIRTFEEGGVAGAHLEGSFARDVRGAPSTWPDLWVEELTRVVGAVAEARAVEIGVARLVDLLCCVALHEQVDRHDSCTLQWGKSQLKQSVDKNVEMRNKWNNKQLQQKVTTTGPYGGKELVLFTCWSSYIRDVKLRSSWGAVLQVLDVPLL